MSTGVVRLRTCSNVNFHASVSGKGCWETGEGKQKNVRGVATATYRNVGDIHVRRPDFLLSHATQQLDAARHQRLNQLALHQQLGPASHARTSVLPIEGTNANQQQHCGACSPQADDAVQQSVRNKQRLVPE